MSSDCNVKVMCRIRPLNQKELAAGDKAVVSTPTDTQILQGGKTYSFDKALGSKTTQLEMYEGVAKSIVKDVLGGYNGTIFAYGQTSSGKTHTMEGVLNDPELQGIIPRIVNDIFEHIYTLESCLEIHIKVSYFEIYMEKIRDLLDVTKVNLPVHEDKNKIPYVKGVTERFVATPEEVLQTIDEGKSNRHVSVTNMNAHSSRSHAVFLISITQENSETHKKIHGKLFLVDLAGSERVEKTDAKGLTLDEAKAINVSLFALGNVINALSSGLKFVPYRDSKLTRVLQESLGGNARTTLVICCSPASSNEPETKGTLQFGERAKAIKNKVSVNEELTAEEWRRRYEKEKELSKKLKVLLVKYESELTRWRAGEAVPEEEFVKISLRDISTANIAAEEMGGASETATPSLSRQSSVTNSINSDTPTHSTTTLPTLHTNTPPENRNHIPIENCVNGEIPSSAANLIHELKHSNTKNVSNFSNALRREEHSNTSSSSILNSSGAPRREDIVLLETEREKLYAALDEKDEEIHQHTHMMEQLTLRLSEKEESLEQAQEEHKQQQNQITSIEQELSSTQDELKEVMEALEELAVSYERQDGEMEASNEEKVVLQCEIEKLQYELQERTQQFLAIQEVGDLRQRTATDLVQTLVEKIADISEVFEENSHSKLPAIKAGGPISAEDVTKICIHVSNLQTEAASLTKQKRDLEMAHNELENQTLTAVSELSQCKLKISQCETQHESLMATLRKTEMHKAQLEQRVESLNEELVSLRAREHMMVSAQFGQQQENLDVMRSANEVKVAMEKQLERHWEQHQQQIETLKSEVSQREAALEHLQFQLQVQQQERCQLEESMHQMHQEHAAKIESLSTTSMKAQVQARTTQQLGGLMETVDHEVKKLDDFKGTLLQEMMKKINKVKPHAAAAAEGASPAMERRNEVTFLEHNLQQLTMNHKQVVKQLTLLQKEQPKLKAVLNSKAKRIAELEKLVEKTKQVAKEEHDKYEETISKMRQNYITKLKNGPAYRSHGPQIVKPVQRNIPTSMASAPQLLALAGVKLVGNQRLGNSMRQTVS